MGKTWLVAKHEYLETVKQKSFLLATLGAPLLMIGIMSVMFFVLLRKTNNNPVGYVDLAGILQSPETTEQLNREKESFVFQSYSDEEDAQKALFAEEIQAYYVLPPDYRQSASVYLYYLDEEPSDLLTIAFGDFIQLNLVQGLPAEIQTRLMDGIHLTLHSADGKRTFGQQSTRNFFFSLGVAMLFYIAAMSASGYMTKAIGKEKENRTIEILLTSLSPSQIIQGKLLGLAGITLTQLLIWTAPLSIGLTLAISQIQTLKSLLKIPWEMIGVTVLYFVPTYLLLSNILIIIGASAEDTDQSTPLAGFLSLFFNLPLMFLPALFSNPNHPFFVFLSILPTSTFITTVVRWSLTTIPLWQVLTSWGLLAATTVASAWVSSRLFHVTMLNYGERFTLKKLVTALRLFQRV